MRATSVPVDPALVAALADETGHQPDRKKELLDAALAYAARGWPVFPVHTPIVRDGKTFCSCNNPHLGEDARNIGKHPRTRNGFKDATTDPEVIRSWWATWPEANIGIVPGPVEGRICTSQ